MTSTIAFHGDPKTQAKYVNRVETHYELDEIIKGRYWENGKGCAVGCCIHSSGNGETPHQLFASQLGYPLQVAHLIDGIFENLPDDRAKDWPLAVISAPMLGADLSQVWPQFATWLMTDPEFGVENLTDDAKIKTMCREVAEGYRTGQTTGPQAEDLARRLRAARAEEELKAGRDLDALIAEKVMGWTRQRGSFDGTTHWHPDSVILIGPNDTYSPHGLTTKPITYIGNIVPHFSTSIADAWLVVEKMRESHGFWVDLQSSGLDPKLWKITMHRSHPTHLPAPKRVVEASFSAPEAICRCALAALESASSVPPIPKGNSE